MISVLYFNNNNNLPKLEVHEKLKYLQKFVEEETGNKTIVLPDDTYLQQLSELATVCELESIKAKIDSIIDDIKGGSKNET